MKKIVTLVFIAFLVGMSITASAQTEMLQFKDDYDEQLMLEAMKNNRQNIRSEFNTAATVLDDYSADYIRQCVIEPMEQSVRSVEDNIAELRDTRSNRSEKCKKLERVQKEIQSLISRIHDAEE